MRLEAARLKSLLRQQLFGLYPKLLAVWSRVDTPGPLAVVRLGLTPAQIAALPLSEFRARVCDRARGATPLPRKVRVAHEKPHAASPPASRAVGTTLPQTSA